MEWRRQNERCSFFIPNEPQEQAIKLIGEGKDFIVILSAANGIGKTTVVVNVLANLIWGPQSKYFDLPMFRNWPFEKRARFITDPKLVEEIGPFHSEILKWWPKGRYESLKAGHNYFSQYKANKWVIDVMTYEQDAKEFEGVNLGITVLDEPPPQKLWSPVISRHRKGGIVFVPMTPLTEAAWFFDQVVPANLQSIVYADIEQNCKDHAKNGQLEHKHIEQMISNWPEEEIEARAHGKAMYLRGLIFKTFDKNVHVLKENIRPPFGAQVWNVVDPHSDKPFASIWAFPDSRGDIYIFDEWPNEDFYKMHNCQLTIQDYKKLFGDKEAGLSIHRRIIDRHFADTPAAVNKRTLRQELQGIGLNYQPSYKAEEEIDTGIEKIRRHLAYDTSKPLSPLNQPKLYISPKCTNTIKSMTNWARDPETGKVLDAFKDYVDCIRYLLMDNPKMGDLIPPQEFKKRWG